jgi:hypothetical protein
MTFATDAYEAEIDAAGQRHGVPENFLEAQIIIESGGGDWSKYAGVVRSDIRPGNPMVPFTGIFQTTADSWGCPDVFTMSRDRAAQIDCQARIDRGWMDQLSANPGGYGLNGQPSWLNVETVYFGGPGALRGEYVDEFGTSSIAFINNFANIWKGLDAEEGVNTFNGGPGQPGSQPRQCSAGEIPFAGRCFKTKLGESECQELVDWEDTNPTVSLGSLDAVNLFDDCRAKLESGDHGWYITLPGTLIAAAKDGTLPGILGTVIGGSAANAVEGAKDAVTGALSGWAGDASALAKEYLPRVGLVAAGIAVAVVGITVLLK